MCHCIFRGYLWRLQWFAHSENQIEQFLDTNGTDKGKSDTFGRVEREKWYFTTMDRGLLHEAKRLGGVIFRFWEKLKWGHERNYL